MKQKFIDYYMDIADLTSKLSSAIRLNVGAVIVKGNKILGTGYNGMPTGWRKDIFVLFPTTVSLIQSSSHRQM